MQVLDFSFPPAPRRVCRVRVGAGVLGGLADDLAQDSPGGRLFLVSDSNVAPLHAEPLADALGARGLTSDLLVFPAGEASKTRETVADLVDRLAAAGAGRDAVLVAVGGGVTGDLAGFVAATWQRGVPLVQVPTSLVAMVDAALGGKTAINLPAGKNLVGAFHQPWGIYADVAVLGTLQDSDFRDGFAEVVKSAVIADAALFDGLESTRRELLAREPAVLARTVTNCLRIKRDVVRADERESGRRAMLNFGHTVAHALEAEADWAVSHGRAVAIGMSVEGELAVDRTGFPRPDLGRLRSLLDGFGLPVRPPADLSEDALLDRARMDKKSRLGRLRCSLPCAIGRMPAGEDVTVAVEEPELRAAFRAAAAAVD